MPLRIGIIVDPKFAHGRNFLRGAIRYIQEERPEVEIEVFAHDYPKDIETIQQFDGLIAAMDLAIAPEILTKTKIVSVGFNPDSTSNSEFDLDDQAIGQLAAEKLHQTGVASYGYYDCLVGHRALTRRTSQNRLKGFQQRIEALSTQLLSPELFVYNDKTDQTITQWLNQLPKPAGILAFNDLEALKLAEVCRHHRIAVPEDVMIIGIDNDQLLCSLNQPKITSINTGMEQLSFNAMRALIQSIESNSIIRSLTPEQRPAPSIVLRESTGHCSNSHPVIQRALSAIEQCTPHRTSPKDIAASIGLSLRSLEAHFKDHLEQTIQSKLLEAQLNQVKHLLRTTDATIEAISAQIDWDPSSLQHAFKRTESYPPGKYRARFRPDPPSVAPTIQKRDARQITLGIVTTLNTHAHHELLRGMQDYTSAHPNIHLALRIAAEISEQNETTLGLGNEQSFANYDGFVITTEVKMPDDILASKPIITIDHERTKEHSIAFKVDNYRAGVLAAEHFLQKGYTQFAFVSYKKNSNSAITDTRADKRFQGFYDTLIQAAIPQQNIQRTDTSQLLETLNQWIDTLPSKTAIYAFNDSLSKTLLHTCKKARRAVPDDIALLSTDNDAFLCDITTPSLSSIDVEFRKAGYEIASTLVKIIQKPESLKSIHGQIQSRQIVERASTHALGTDDPNVIRAMHYIKANYRTDIGVDNIVNDTEVSRRTLEGLFQQHLHRTIRQQLEKTRMDMACDLLSRTQLSVKEIAIESGFKNSRHFCMRFKERIGETPQAYRKALSISE